jgi:hypothetical protein
MNILKEFNNTKTKVEFLLTHYKSLRDNDIKLWISYLVMYYNLQKSLSLTTDPCQSFCDLVLDDNVPSIASIIRVRQKLQEDGSYPKLKNTIKRGRKTDIRGNVEGLLKSHKPLRDDDKKLWLAYLITHHNLKEKMNTSSDPYETLCDILIDDIPGMDTIRRTRQQIQEAGLYVGEKRKQRLVAAKQVSKWAKGG